MALIPAGWFQMGKADGDPDQRPVRRIWVNNFLLDRREVSNQDFAQYLNKTAKPPFDKDLVGQNLVGEFGLEIVDNQIRPKPGMENLPVVYVTWSQANEYCRVQGKSLPTEAQWEKACQLGSRGHPLQVSRLWGNGPANIHRWWRPRPDPVDSFGPDAAGLYHMRGNIAEYMDDIYRPDWYANMPEEDPNQLEALPGIKKQHRWPAIRILQRSARGGAFSLTPDFSDCAKRSFRNQTQADRNNFTGFRCAYSPPRKK